MTNIILSGACGRMGRAVAEAVAADCNVNVLYGCDISATNGDAASAFPVYPDIFDCPADGADVIVDFSHHTSAGRILEYAVANSIPALIATTGHTEEELALIAQASEKVAVFRSGNMSLGINLLTELCRRAAAALGEDFDVEIIERHHNQKLDAPSGTAIMLADAISGELPYDAEYTYDRHDLHRVRGKCEIGIHSVRGGNIVGEHEVMFAGQDEIITLSHSASSRSVFAHGAVRAAKFLAGKPAGLYNMGDVINASL